MPSLFETISQVASPENHPQLRAKFEVTWFGYSRLCTEVFPTQTEAKDWAKFKNGLYSVVMYVRGKRVVIFEKQY